MMHLDFPPAPPYAVPVNCRVLLIACCIMAAVGSRSAARGQCTGDCDGNGQVDISELTRGVEMLLDPTVLDSCGALFREYEAPAMTIADLVLAVNNALNGCRGCPPLNEPYSAPCVMPIGKAICVPATPMPVITVGAWIIESDGSTIRIEQDGIHPPLVYFAIADGMNFATIVGIGTGKKILHPARGEVTLIQGRDNSVLVIGSFAPGATDGSCQVVEFIGAF